MKITRTAKFLGLMVLAATLATGCATAPESKPEPAAAGASAEAKAAIAAAKAAIGKAKSVGGLWRDTDKTLEKAEKAAEKGDNADAIKNANKAKGEAEMGYNQALLEKAKFIVGVIEGQYKSLTDAQKAELEKAKGAIKRNDGELAYNTASALLAELQAKTSVSYMVEKGDSLWRISGKDTIYGNPYQWPLIYKANADQIKDADLIYPGQDLSIDTNPSAADVDAAVSHAKTRGAWAVGVVEDSDKAYLGK